MVSRPQTVTPYRGAYKQDNDTPVDPATTNTATPPTGTPNTATPSAGTELPPEERTYKDRYDHLKAHYDRTIIDSRKRIVELEAQVSKVNRKEIPTNPEDFLRWKTQYPDLYRMIVNSVREEMDGTAKEMQGKLEHLELLTKKERRKTAEAALLRLHPDFENLKNSEDFHNWVREQPSQIQSWLYDNEDDALLAAKAIDLYKVEKGLHKSSKKTTDVSSAAQAVTRTASVAEPQMTQGKIWKLSEIAKLNRRDYERLEGEIDQARMEGRIDQS